MQRPEKVKLSYQMISTGFILHHAIYTLTLFHQHQNKQRFEMMEVSFIIYIINASSAYSQTKV